MRLSFFYYYLIAVIAAIFAAFGCFTWTVTILSIALLNFVISAFLDMLNRGAD